MSLSPGARCNFSQLAQSTTGKWISSINHGTLFRIEIKDSCLRLLKRQVWSSKPLKCTLWIRVSSSSNFWGDVTFNIYSMAQLCEATLLTANASGVLSSRGGHLCLFSIKSGSLISPLSSFSSSRIRFTLYVAINYSFGEMGRSHWWSATRSLTHHTYWLIFAGMHDKVKWERFWLTRVQISHIWYKLVKLIQFGNSCFGQNAAWFSRMRTSAGLVWFNAKFMG